MLGYHHRIKVNTKLDMKLNRSLFVMAASLATWQAASAADIVGKITLKGTPPPEKELPLDANCGKLHPASKPTTRFYITDGNGGLADTFIYLKEGLTGKTFEVPAESKFLDQKGCEYTPYVSGVQTKQKLAVKNSDELLHNVHPTPAVPGNKESNQAQLPKSKDLIYSYDNQEILLRIKCDVHPWMFAYVGVVDHPFYAVSAKDGTFKISNVPAGEYTLEAFHRKGGKVTQKVTVGAGNATTDFTFAVPPAQ